VVAGFPRNLSHAHAFNGAEIKPKLREKVRMLCKGVAEDQGDCLRLLPDLVEFELDCLSQFLYLCPHNLQLDHFVHLLIQKRSVVVGLLYIQSKPIFLCFPFFLECLFDIGNLVVDAAGRGWGYLLFF
jgi:hypothetical protein